MMKKISLTLLLISFFNVIATAQNFERCASHKYCEHKGYNLEELLIENQKHFLAKSANDLVVIPVVVHVVHNVVSGAIEDNNISFEQIKSQIDRLNEDFGGNNPELSTVPEYFQDITAFDGIGIQFKLAEIDPDGNATDGITRTYTEKTSFDYEEDDIKRAVTGGADAWPRDSYLNIWVCPSINEGNALGYAQFPNPVDDPLTDGLCVAHNYFGDDTGTVNPLESGAYYKGRTLVHEMGHFFGLTHIWGNDNGTCISDDGIIDTPKQADSYYGCPEEGTESCESLDMFMNYMDYTDDECMYLFSVDQAERIYEVLTTHPTRVGLVTSGETAFEECAVQVGTILSPNEFSICFDGATENLNVINDNENYQKIWVIAEPDGSIIAYQVGDNVNFYGFAPGYYGVTVINTLPSGAVDIFNLIDDNDWTVFELSNELNNGAYCAEIQTFGYPLFTVLSEAQSTDCYTDISNLFESNFEISTENGILYIKGITEIKLNKLDIYSINGSLLAQHIDVSSQITLPDIKGVLILAFLSNDQQYVLKVYNY